MASDIIERWRQLCPPLLPFTHARSESINADSLNSNFLQLGRRSGGRPQRAVRPHAVTCQHCDTHYFSRPRTRNLPTFLRAIPVVPPSQPYSTVNILEIRQIRVSPTCTLPHSFIHSLYYGIRQNADEITIDG